MGRSYILSLHVIVQNPFTKSKRVLKNLEAVPELAVYIILFGCFSYPPVPFIVMDLLSLFSMIQALNYSNALSITLVSSASRKLLKVTS